MVKPSAVCPNCGATMMADNDGDRWTEFWCPKCDAAVPYTVGNDLRFSEKNLTSEESE